jgi:hypothetical protein
LEGQTARRIAALEPISKFTKQLILADSPAAQSSGTVRVEIKGPIQVKAPRKRAFETYAPIAISVLSLVFSIVFNTYYQFFRGPSLKLYVGRNMKISRTSVSRTSDGEAGESKNESEERHDAFACFLNLVLSNAGAHAGAVNSMDILAGPGSSAPIGHLVAHLEYEEIADDRLRLIFTCCHPALPPEGQAALSLREICGLTWLKKMQWLSISVSPNDYLIETNLNRRKKCLPPPISLIQPNCCSSH